jgi:hypothetical protein
MSSVTELTELTEFNSDSDLFNEIENENLVSSSSIVLMSEAEPI